MKDFLKQACLALLAVVTLILFFSQPADDATNWVSLMLASKLGALGAGALYCHLYKVWEY